MACYTLLYAFLGLSHKYWMYTHITVLCVSYKVNPSHQTPEEWQRSVSKCFCLQPEPPVTKRPNLSSLSARAPTSAQTHTNAYTYTRTHTTFLALSKKQTWKLNDSGYIYLFVTSSGGVFPAVIVWPVYCIVSSPSCSVQDSSLCLSLFVPVFWGAPLHSLLLSCWWKSQYKFFSQGPTSQRYSPLCGLCAPQVVSGTWFKSRPLKQTEPWRLMPWVFHKGWGRVQEGGEGGREGRSRGMRVWELETAFFSFGLWLFFWSGPTYLWCFSDGKRQRKRITELPFLILTTSSCGSYEEVN